MPGNDGGPGMAASGLPCPRAFPLPPCRRPRETRARCCLSQLLEATAADPLVAPGPSCLPLFPLHSPPLRPRGFAPVLCSGPCPLPPKPTKPSACQTQGTTPVFILMTSGTGAMENPFFPNSSSPSTCRSLPPMILPCLQPLRLGLVSGPSCVPHSC